jgi:hypothetical protein
VILEGRAIPGNNASGRVSFDVHHGILLEAETKWTSQGNPFPFNSHGIFFRCFHYVTISSIASIVRFKVSMDAPAAPGIWPGPKAGAIRRRMDLRLAPGLAAAGIRPAERPPGQRRPAGRPRAQKAGPDMAGRPPPESRPAAARSTGPYSDTAASPPPPPPTAAASRPSQTWSRSQASESESAGCPEELMIKAIQKFGPQRSRQTDPHTDQRLTQNQMLPRIFLWER